MCEVVTASTTSTASFSLHLLISIQFFATVKGMLCFDAVVVLRFCRVVLFPCLLVGCVLFLSVFSFFLASYRSTCRVVVITRLCSISPPSL